MKILALVFSLLFCINAQAAGISFGIVPQQAPVELAKRWGPIMQYLTEQTGLEIEFKTARDLKSFQDDMRSGTYDVVFINPYYYATIGKIAGYTVFAGEKDADFVALVVARKNAAINTLQDLNRKPVAFASPTAVASMQVFTHMKNEGISLTPVYVVSMDSVYRSVAKGMFPAGVGELRTLNSIDPEVRGQLRVIWNAEPLPPLSFSAHPRVARADVEKIQRAMLKMSQNAKGLALLKSINMKGIQVARDSDYDQVRKLKLMADQLPGI